MENTNMENNARALAELLNNQPTIYTDENVFEYAEDDEDEDWM